MPVEIAKVAGVDPPRPFVRLAGQRCTGRLRLGEQRVYVRLAGDQLADAELSRLRRPKRHIGVLRELGARIQGQGSPPASSNIAARPDGFVSSPVNCVPITPADSSPS